MNGNNRKYGAFSSSANPENLSLTVKGILLALIPIAIAFAKGFSIELSESEITAIIEQTFMVVSGITILYGLLRKLYNRFK